MSNRKSSVSLGPGASSLILIFVALSMSVLAMLSLMSARNDLRLSERSAEVTEAVYRLEARAEYQRAALNGMLKSAADAAGGDQDAYLALIETTLPDNVTLDEGRLCWAETDGYRTLDCALTVLPLGGEARSEWARHDLTSETGDFF